MKSRRRSVVLGAVCLVALTCGAASPLDELMPVPKRIDRQSETVPASVLGNVKIVLGTVEGAPAGVAEESYAISVAISSALR